MVSGELTEPWLIICGSCKYHVFQSAGAEVRLPPPSRELLGRLSVCSVCVSTVCWSPPTTSHIIQMWLRCVCG